MEWWSRGERDDRIEGRTRIGTDVHVRSSIDVHKKEVEEREERSRRRGDKQSKAVKLKKITREMQSKSGSRVLDEIEFV